MTAFEIPDTVADWEMNTSRRETGLIEHHCLTHGTGHPNPGSALWLAEVHRARAVERAAQAIERGETGDEVTISTLEEWEAAWLSHGCCGCCRTPTFPGYREALLHAHGLIREGNENRTQLAEQGRKLLLACRDAGISVEGFPDLTPEALEAYRREVPPADFGWRYRLWQAQGFFRDNGAWRRGLWSRHG